MKIKSLRIFVCVVLACFTVCLTACTSKMISSVPCSCGKTPTRGYENKDSGEIEYYCKECSSDCEFCSEKATEHYTSGLGIIIFACEECYQEIMEY